MSTLIRSEIAGASIFWTLGEETDHTRYAEALKQAGFGKFTPQRPTEAAALKQTLATQFGGASYDIDPIKGAAQPTFEVCTVRTIDVNNGRNIHDHKLTARVTVTGNVTTDTGDAVLEHTLTERFRRIRSTVSYQAVSKSLVEIVYSLNGTTLRPSGGIYFVPTVGLERWEMVANALESSSPKNRCFSMRVLLDEHTAAAIREALTAEIAREGAAIEAVLHDPATSLQSAGTQLVKANLLRQKIESYEGMFDLILSDLKKELDNNTGREAIAALLHAASAGPVLTDAVTGSLNYAVV